MAINANSPEAVASLVQELERRHKSARDLVIPASEFKVEIATPLGETVPRPMISLPDGTGFGSRQLVGLKDTALVQTVNKLKVPTDYARRILAGYPELFANTINTLAPGQGDDRWLIRMLADAGSPQPQVRANLSDKFRVLDNYDLFFRAYKIAQAVGAEISRADLSDDRFEMRLIIREWRERIGYKDEGVHKFYGKGHSDMCPGVYLSNSETGKGGLVVRPFLLDEVCTNGVVLDTQLRAIHLGGANDLGYLSREASEADSLAVWLKVRDLIQLVFNREKFQEIIANFKLTGELRIKQPIEVVDNVVRDYGMTDDDKQAILNELISPSHDRDPGRTVFGLIQAITERAKFYSDPEQRTALEVAAGELLTNEGKRAQLVTVKAKR